MNRRQAEQKAKELAQQAYSLVEEAVASGCAHPEVKNALTHLNKFHHDEETPENIGWEGQFVTPHPAYNPPGLERLSIRMTKGQIDRRQSTHP